MDSVDKTVQRRSIRSFVLREGRLTAGQTRALDLLWPRFGLECQGEALDLPAAFGREARTVLEIGFGNGEALADAANRHPDWNFIGIEVHRPGVGRLLMSVEEMELKNVRVMRHDAMEVLAHCLGENSLDELRLYFPDPWHKKKHHKRRIVQGNFLDQLSRTLKPGGLVHMATDWQNYAEHMMEELESHPAFVNIAGPGVYSDSGERIETRFQRRGEAKGHGVWDLMFRCQESS